MNLSEGILGEIKYLTVDDTYQPKSLVLPIDTLVSNLVEGGEESGFMAARIEEEGIFVVETGFI